MFAGVSMLFCAVIGGGLDVAKSATLVVSLPLLVIGVAMAVPLFRLLREDRATLDGDSNRASRVSWGRGQGRKI